MSPGVLKFLPQVSPPPYQRQATATSRLSNESRNKIFKVINWRVIDVK